MALLVPLSPGPQPSASQAMPVPLAPDLALLARASVWSRPRARRCARGSAEPALCNRCPRAAPGGSCPQSCKILSWSCPRGGQAPQTPAGPKSRGKWCIGTRRVQSPCRSPGCSLPAPSMRCPLLLVLWAGVWASCCCVIIPGNPSLFPTWHSPWAFLLGTLAQARAKHWGSQLASGWSGEQATCQLVCWGCGNGIGRAPMPSGLGGLHCKHPPVEVGLGLSQQLPQPGMCWRRGFADGRVLLSCAWRRVNKAGVAAPWVLSPPVPGAEGPMAGCFIPVGAVCARR